MPATPGNPHPRPTTFSPRTHVLAAAPPFAAGFWFADQGRRKLSFWPQRAQGHGGWGGVWEVGGVKAASRKNIARHPIRSHKLTRKPTYFDPLFTEFYEIKRKHLNVNTHVCLMRTKSKMALVVSCQWHLLHRAIQRHHASPGHWRM